MMRKGVFLLILLMLAGIGMNLQAQPQYSYTTGSSANNYIPFRHATLNFRQSLYYPSNFSGATSGMITKIYIKASASVMSTFTNVTIKLGSTNLSTFSTGPYSTGLTTVYNGAATLSTGSGNWIEVALTTPYAYDHTKNLIFEFSQTGYSPGFYGVFANSGVTDRSLIGGTSASSGSTQARLVHFGFDLAAKACTSPGGLNLSNIEVNSAHAAWRSDLAAVSYEYLYSTSRTSPVSGTTTMDTFINDSTLSANTQYYFHLKKNCGSSSSSWVVDSFITKTCGAPTIAVGNVTDTSAEFTWNRLQGVSTFEHALTTVMTPPASGTASNNPASQYTGLIPNTMYYFHARSSCNMDFSPWSTHSFTTDSSASVGIEEQLHKGGFGLSAFPNPTDNELNIQVNGEPIGQGSILIFDLKGKLVHSETIIKESTIKLMLEQLDAGIYLLKYIDQIHHQTLRISKV